MNPSNLFLGLGNSRHPAGRRTLHVGDIAGGLA